MSKQKTDTIIPELKKLYINYKNHGDSLKWFRERKKALLVKHGLKSKEEQDNYLVNLKKSLSDSEEIKPFL